MGKGEGKTFKSKGIRCVVIVVIVFLLLLAYIGLRVYNSSKHETRGRQSEPFIIALNIREAENRYYELNKKYSADPVEIGLDLPMSPKQYEYKIVYADEKSYKAEIWGNIDSDATIDTWVISSDDYAPINVMDDVSN